MRWCYKHESPSEVARLKEQNRKNEEYWNKRYCEQAEHIESLRNQLEIKTKQYENLLVKYLKLTNGKKEEN